jgi:hypothetical protein
MVEPPCVITQQPGQRPEYWPVPSGSLRAANQQADQSLQALVAQGYRLIDGGPGCPLRPTAPPDFVCSFWRERNGRATIGYRLRERIAHLYPAYADRYVRLGCDLPRPETITNDAGGCGEIWWVEGDSHTGTRLVLIRTPEQTAWAELDATLHGLAATLSWAPAGNPDAGHPHWTSVLERLSRYPAWDVREMFSRFVASYYRQHEHNGHARPGLGIGSERPRRIDLE